MSYHDIRECRFCKAHATGLLKYGTRHYAHPACFLDHGHTLAELKPWQIATLPFVVLKARGLLLEAERIIKAEERKRMERGQPSLLYVPELDDGRDA